MIEALENPALKLKNIDEFFAKGYADDIDTNKVVMTTIARLQQAIDRVNDGQEALIDAVNEALNVTALRTALTNLGIKNVAAATTFDLEYFDAIEENTTETKEQIQAVIDNVNLTEITALVEAAEISEKQADVTKATTALTAVKAADTNFDKPAEGETKGAFEKRLDAVQKIINVEAAITAVNTAADGDALLAALKGDDLGDVKESVIDDNKDAYKAKVDALVAEDAEFAFETVVEIQDFIDEVNLEEAIKLVNTFVIASPDKDSLLAALKDATNKILALENVVDRNKEVYAVELAAIFEDNNEFKFETIADIQAFVDAANATPVGLVNTAKKMVDMQAALTNEELDLDLGMYNLLSDLQKGIVANELVQDTTSYKDAAAVQSALDGEIANVL